MNIQFNLTYNGGRIIGAFASRGAVMLRASSAWASAPPSRGFAGTPPPPLAQFGQKKKRCGDLEQCNTTSGVYRMDKLPTPGWVCYMVY